MRHTLIVGAKHIGKSTMIQSLLRELQVRVAGFETKKEDGMPDDMGRCPVYLYPVNIERSQRDENRIGWCQNGHSEVFPQVFDRYAPFLQQSQADLILMDELGIMESQSEAFCSAVLKLLDGDIPVLAAVKDKDNDFLREVREHPNCRCFYLTVDNRNTIRDEVLDYLRQQLKASSV